MSEKKYENFSTFKDIGNIIKKFFSHLCMLEMVMWGCKILICDIFKHRKCHRKNLSDVNGCQKLLSVLLLLISDIREC